MTYNLFPFLVQGFLEACISGGSLPSIYDPWLPAWNLPTQRALQDKMLPKRLKVSYKACKPRLGKKNTYFCKKETSTLLIFHRRSYKTQQNTKIPLNRNTKKKKHTKWITISSHLSHHPIHGLVIDVAVQISDLNIEGMTFLVGEGVHMEAASGRSRG